MANLNRIGCNSLIDQFKDAVLNRESALMGKSFWNSSETLQLRKDKLRSLSSDYHRTGNDQQTDYLALRSSLADNMSRFIGPNGDVRIAISFDGHGNVGGAAIV